MIKIVLAGTPEFSVPIFEELINNFEVLAIISQPDQRAKRGNFLVPTPTKELAQKYNIPCLQPNKIKEIYDELKTMEYDFLVTAAYGQIIPQSVLDLAKVKNVNVHGSLLPKYRGAAPIQHSLLNGDKETGITLIEMVKAMDAGDMYAKVSLPINEEDTSSTLFNKLSLLAKDNIVQWIKDIYDNKITPEIQDVNYVTFANKLEKEAGEIKADMSIQEAINIIKAYEMNPGAFYIESGKRIKLFNAQKEPLKNALIIKLADGNLYVYDYQYDSKKRVNVKK